ncbi:MAG: YlmC/YmxH family sporulation protein [Firmicutes bacterium]|nr:YlmC/YmxH family sporulation protein [Bacillota bacterium]
MSRISDLKLREVINLADGKRLGFIEDIELDLESGRIRSIIVPGKSSFWLLRSENIVIPWEQVQRFGTDVILVDLPSLAKKENSHYFLKEPGEY